MAEDQSPAPAAGTGVHFTGIDHIHASHAGTRRTDLLGRVKAANHMKADSQANGTDFALAFRGENDAAAHTGFTGDFFCGSGFGGERVRLDTFLPQHPGLEFLRKGLRHDLVAHPGLPDAVHPVELQDKPNQQNQKDHASINGLPARGPRAPQPGGQRGQRRAVTTRACFA